VWISRVAVWLGQRARFAAGGAHNECIRRWSISDAARDDLLQSCHMCIHAWRLPDVSQDGDWKRCRSETGRVSEALSLASCSCAACSAVKLPP